MRVCREILLIPPCTSSVSWCWILTGLSRVTCRSLTPEGDSHEDKLPSWVRAPPNQTSGCVSCPPHDKHGSSLRSQSSPLQHRTTHGKLLFVEPVVYFWSLLHLSNIFSQTHIWVHVYTSVHRYAWYAQLYTHTLFRWRREGEGEEWQGCPNTVPTRVTLLSLLTVFTLRVQGRDRTVNLTLVRGSAPILVSSWLQRAKDLTFK